MKKLLQLLRDYLAALPVFIMAYYAVTAKPDGQFQWIITPVNLWLDLSFGLTDPLLLHWLPRWRKNHLKMTSLTQRANQTTPLLVTSKLPYDDQMNLALLLLERGIIMLLSVPLVILIGCFKLGRQLIHHQ